MPRYGFSGTEPDMRKLILHILTEMGEPADERELTGLALLDGNADYFVYADALDAVCGAALAVRKNGSVCLSPRGGEVAAVVAGDLPASLRRAVAEGCAAARERQLRSRCVRADTEDSEVRCLLTDGTVPLLELRLQTGGEKQAKAFAKRFTQEAGFILERVWEAFTSGG